MEKIVERPLCRLCGQPLSGLFYTQGDNDEFIFQRCKNCKLVNYQLSGGLDQGKYAQEFPDPCDNALRRNKAQTETYAFLSRFLSSPGRLLEVGCGNGRLLHLSRQDGWEVSGAELSAFMASSVRERLNIPVVAADIAEPGLAEDLGLGSFDVIVLRHVLEHVPDPIALMQLFGKLLTTGGHVVLEFPNIDALHFRFQRMLRSMSMHRKVYGAEWRPGHCNEYCRESFRYLVEKTGFAVMVWETYSSNPIRNWVLSRWPIGTKARVLVQKS